MSWKKNFLLVSLLLVSFIALYGCGSDNKSSGVSLSNVPRVSETACAQCHGSAIDSNTGENIYTAYTQSKHFTNNFHLVGCQDCHGGGAQHNGVGPIPYPNPDEVAQCFNCHKNYLNTAHYKNYTASGSHPAQYVSKMYENSCTSCHNPHKPGPSNEHKQWAESGHGDINGVAWSDRDFKDTAACIRCHTSTGFIDYVTNNFNEPSNAWAKADDNSREVLTCKACHTNYNFKNRVRNVAKYKPSYKNTLKDGKFSDYGLSNLCVPCHAGRVSGEDIKNTTANLSNSNFGTFNSHYLAAAGVLEASLGYHYTGRVYSNYSSPIVHNKIGLGITGNANVDNNFREEGPCVACHLTSNDGSHKLSPFTTYGVGDVALNPICVNCHSTRGAGSNAKVAWYEGQWLLRFNAGLTALEETLKSKGIYFKTAYPYFYQSDLTTRFTDWTSVYGAGSAKDLVGAAYNFNMLKHEPGAIAHNRYYVRRLIYDSIDFADDGILNYSTGATIDGLITAGKATSDAKTLLVKGATTGTSSERY